MEKLWVIYVNGIKWTSKLTEQGANWVADDLRRLGKQRVSVAYQISKETL